MSQQQLTQIFNLANKASALEDFEKSASYYRALINHTKVHMDDAFQLNPENIPRTKLHFESNLGLAASLCASKEFSKAGDTVLAGLKSLKVVISNAGIPMIYRAFMMTAYKKHFYALSWIYQQSGDLDKLKDFVSINSVSVEDWIVNANMVSEIGKNLN